MKIQIKYKICLIAGILILVAAATAAIIFLKGISAIGSPTGGKAPDYPYFMTTGPTVVKKIRIPKGTKLTYEEHFFKEGQQNKIMNEKKLTGIELPEGKTIDWGGVPVYKIIKFFNPEMQGFSVYADFNKLNNDKKTGFSNLWEGCSEELGITVKNPFDWSFNSSNITKVDYCGMNDMLYFEEDEERIKQQQLPGKLYHELKKIH